MSEEFNNENVVYKDLGRITGLSAFELACQNGFNGTLADWLASLVGPQGNTGPQGETGATGNGIVSVEKTSTNGIIDTYTITFSNGQTFTYELTNGIDTVPVDYTSQLIAVVVYIERGEIGTKLHRWQDGDFSRDTNTHYSSICIEVKAGQMFKLSVSGSANYPAYVLADSELNIVDKNVNSVTDYYLPVKYDGYLLIDTKKDYDSSIRKVTIFDEVEKNQTLLNQAISAIPTVAEVAEEVLSNLPRAEQGAF